MYQDIFPHQYDNTYHPVPPKDTDIILSYTEDQAILKSDDTFFTYKDVPHNRKFQYLFAIDSCHYYLSDLRDISHQKIPVHAFRTFMPKEMGFAGITGWQLDRWMKENRYCGKCGSAMEPDHYERAMRCTNCHHIVYPKIMPAVIVGVRNDQDELLVSKYAHGQHQKYALIAGFTEIGETIEETVRREVKEETGLDVTDITYFTSQPWSFSSTLLLGFYAIAHGDQKLKMDTHELSELKWISKEDTAYDPQDDASLTSTMMHAYFMENKQ